MSCYASLGSQFFSSLFDGLAIGMVYALIALGLSMVYGILNLINFAHGEVFMVGSFAALGILNAVGVGAATGSFGLAGELILAAVAAMVASGLAAMLLEVAAYRPLRRSGAPRHAGMITGMGASIFLQELFGLTFGRGNIPFPEVLPVAVIAQVGDGRITNHMVIIFVAVVVMMVALDWFVMRTRLGRGMRALAQEPRAASLMGVNVSAVVLTTFLVGGLCAGLGGYLYGLYFSKTSYILGFLPGLKGLTASILGGVGNLPGAVLGGIMLGLLENFGVVCIPSQLKDVIGFSALLLILIFRPKGILGERLSTRRGP